MLTALQIVDGFLKSHTIDLALIVASDADPGRGMAEHFPFSPVGAAALCRWSVDDCGLGNIHWLNIPDEGESFSATLGLIDGHNVLRFRKSAAMDQQFALAAAKVTDRCLRQDSLELSAIDAIVAAPARRSYRAALATHLGVPVERITVADDERTHTACFAAAFDRAARQVPSGGHILLVAAGAGITAGAAMYRQP